MAKFVQNHFAQKTSVKVLKVRQEDIPLALEKMLDNYLRGNIILIENFKVPINLDIFEFSSLDEVPIIPLGEAKTTYQKDQRAKDLLIAKADKKTAANYIHKDKEKSEILLAGMQKCEHYVENIFKDMLSLAEDEIESYSTWRFTKTHKQNYHLDIYTGSPLRAFWNLSKEPRAWGFGHKSKDIIKLHKKESVEYFNNINKSFHNIKQNHVNSFLSNLIKDCACHTITFDQYDLWICDSLKVAHQIIGGDKLAAFSYTFDQSKISLNTLSRLRYLDYIYPSFKKLEMRQE